MVVCEIFDGCLYPNLPGGQHHCPGCKFVVHNLCHQSRTNTEGGPFWCGEGGKCQRAVGYGNTKLGPTTDFETTYNERCGAEDCRKPDEPVHTECSLCSKPLHEGCECPCTGGEKPAGEADAEEDSQPESSLNEAEKIRHINDLAQSPSSSKSHAKSVPNPSPRPAPSTPVLNRQPATTHDMCPGRHGATSARSTSGARAAGTPTPTVVRQRMPTNGMATPTVVTRRSTRASVAVANLAKSRECLAASSSAPYWSKPKPGAGSGFTKADLKTEVDKAVGKAVEKAVEKSVNAALSGDALDKLAEKLAVKMVHSKAVKDALTGVGNEVVKNFKEPSKKHMLSLQESSVRVAADGLMKQIKPVVAKAVKEIDEISALRKLQEKSAQGGGETGRGSQKRGGTKDTHDTLGSGAAVYNLDHLKAALCSTEVASSFVASFRPAFEASITTSVSSSVNSCLRERKTIDIFAERFVSLNREHRQEDLLHDVFLGQVSKVVTPSVCGGVKHLVARLEARLTAEKPAGGSSHCMPSPPPRADANRNTLPYGRARAEEEPSGMKKPLTNSPDYNLPKRRRQSWRYCKDYDEQNSSGEQQGTGSLNVQHATSAYNSPSRTYSSYERDGRTANEKPSWQQERHPPPSAHKLPFDRAQPTSAYKSPFDREQYGRR